MPRIDFRLWDRVFILKIICAAQMSFSSFVLILSIYLVILQNWASSTESRHHIFSYTWSIIVTNMLDFCAGTLLGVAANMRGNLRRRLLSYWIVVQTLLIPTFLFLAMQLYFHLSKSKDCLSTDIHYKRISLVQVLFKLCHYVFIAYTIDFLVSGKRRKAYDPTIRPDFITEPTYPQITTTESRRIRLGQSFLLADTSRSSEATNKDKAETETEPEPEPESESSTIRRSILSRILNLSKDDEEKEVPSTSSHK